MGPDRPSDPSLDALQRRVARLEAFLAAQGLVLDASPDASPAAAAKPAASDARDAAPPVIAAWAFVPPPRTPMPPPLPLAPLHPAPPRARDAAIDETFDVAGAPVASPITGPDPTPETTAAPPPPSPAPRRTVDYYNRPAVEPSPRGRAAAIDAILHRRARTTARDDATNAALEQALGLKVAGWVGAIVVVIGAAMGVKFAYDEGWLGGLPDEAKIGLLYALSLAILAVGEWVHRRVDPRAAVGVYAAGVASLFVVSYAGNAYYDLYAPTTAFGLMAGACAIGAMIALRGGLASIAVLSLLGANVAPFVLRGRPVGEVPLLAYVLALQLMAVGLAHVGRGGRWWALRTLALVTTSLWVAGRLFDPATAHTAPTIAFAAIYAIVFHLELILAARRGRAERGERAADLGAPVFSLATFSLAVTGAFAAALLAWSSDFASPLHRGGLLVALAMAAATAGAATAGAWSVAMRTLSASWLTQAALLMFVAVPVSLGGPAITLAWAGLGVAYAALGVALRRRVTVLAGAGAWAAAAVWLAFVVKGERADGPLHAPVTTLFDTPIPTFLVLGLIVGVAGHAVALLAASRRLRPAPPAEDDGLMPSISDAACFVATIVLVGSLAFALPPLGASVGALAVGWALCAVWRAMRRPAYAAAAVAVVALALAKWASVDVLGERVGRGGWDAPARAILFNLPMLVGAALAVSLVALLWLMRSAGTGRRDAGAATWATLVGCVACLTFGLSVEVERAVAHARSAGLLDWPVGQAVQFGWTILWAAAALVIVPIGRWVDSSAERARRVRLAVAIAVMVLATKFTLVDSIGYALAGRRVEAMAFVNLHTVAAALVMAALRLVLRWHRGHGLATAARGALFALPLVVGSIELDRQLGPDRTLAAWSLFWGAYAAASIALGFAVRSAAYRFAGLALLGVTLVKIVAVDLASASTGWRILSFLAVGLILLATSVLYGKLSPRLLGGRSHGRAAG